jgi:hypothetical protein
MTRLEIRTKKKFYRGIARVTSEISTHRPQVHAQVIPSNAGQN